MKSLVVVGSFIMACALAAPVGASVPVAPPARSQVDGAALLTQSDPTTELIGTELFIPAGLDAQSPSQNGLAALVAECILQTPVAARSGERLPLVSTVNSEGGSLSYGVDGQIVRFYLEGLSSEYSGGLLPALRAAVSNPDFSDATLRAARGKVRERLELSGANPLAVGMEMLGRTFYANSDAGLPQYGTAAALMQFSSDDARAFYAAHYRREGSVVSAIGDLQALAPNDLISLVRTLGAGSSRAAVVRTTTLTGNSHQLVAHRDISVPWLVAQYRAPGLRSPDFGAMLVLAAFFSRTLTDVAEVPAVSTAQDSQRSAGAIYNFGTRPASLVFYIGGGLGDPARSFATTLAVAKVLQRARLQGSIDDLKAGAIGFFDGRANTLEERARLAAVFTLFGGGPDYLGRAAEAISMTTPSSLQRAANRYLVSPTVALILPRAAPVPAP